MAYQGYGHQLGPEPIAALYRLTVGAFAPDLTLVLDLPVEAGLGRAAGRNHNETRYERMDRAFHERVRQGFLRIAASDSRRCVVIDATGSLDAVTAEVFAAVADRLKIPVKA